MYLCVGVCKEGNVLFNDALNTFYLWLYGVRHIEALIFHDHGIADGIAEKPI